MTYHRQIRIEFNHCDPAGIVFYPRYFEMINSVIENFFRDIGQHPYEVMMVDGAGVPTARLETVFHAPSRLGDVVDWRLQVVKLGKTSVGFHLEAWSGESHRVTADLVLVFVREKSGPTPWPQALRDRIAAFQEAG